MRWTSLLWIRCRRRRTLTLLSANSALQWSSLDMIKSVISARVRSIIVVGLFVDDSSSSEDKLAHFRRKPVVRRCRSRGGGTGDSAGGAHSPPTYVLTAPRWEHAPSDNFSEVKWLYGSYGDGTCRSFRTRFKSVRFCTPTCQSWLDIHNYRRSLFHIL